MFVSLSSDHCSYFLENFLSRRLRNPALLKGMLVPLKWSAGYACLKPQGGGIPESGYGVEKSQVVDQCRGMKQ